MSEEKPKLEEIYKLVEDAFYLINEVDSRFSIIVSDLETIIKRIERGLSDDGVQLIMVAVSELKVLKEYLNKVVADYVAGATIKVGEVKDSIHKLL